MITSLRWHLAGIPDRVIAEAIGWKATRMLDVYVGSTHSGADAAAAVELLVIPAPLEVYGFGSPRTVSYHPTTSSAHTQPMTRP